MKVTVRTNKLFLCVSPALSKPWYRIAVWCLFGFLFLPSVAEAQDMAVKTNALGWGTLSPNLAFEYRVAPKWTLDLSLSYNPFTFKDNKKWRHISVQPEARYWICAPFGGHFVGAHLLYMHYNAGNIRLPFGIWDQLRNYRFQGNLYGGGLVYGYHHIINKRWSIEGAIGLGFAHTCSKYYRCRNCGRYIGIAKKNVFMPTKLSLSVVYVID